MEALQVLENKIKALREEREALEKHGRELQRRVEQYEEQRQNREPETSVFEKIARGKVVGPAETKAKQTREKICAIDEQLQRLEERVERMTETTGAEREEEERASRAALTEEFELGVQRASQRLEREQRLLEGSRRELEAMRLQG